MALHEMVDLLNDEAEIDSLLLGEDATSDGRRAFREFIEAQYRRF